MNSSIIEKYLRGIIRRYLPYYAFPFEIRLNLRASRLKFTTESLGYTRKPSKYYAICHPKNFVQRREYYLFLPNTESIPYEKYFMG